MEIGVVLPVYNQNPKYIFECLNSIEAQEFRQFRLVIVSDGANDETVEAVENASKILTIPYQIIYRKENKGIAFSLNEGFSHLQDCCYLTWVSSDNRYYSTFLQSLYEQMQNAPENTVLVYSLYRIIDKKGKRKGFEINRRNEMIKFMSRKKKDIVQSCFIGAAFLFKQCAFSAAGGYDSKFEGVEDHEFWIRLLRLGEIKLVPEFLMDYRINGDYSRTGTTSRRELEQKSETVKAYHNNAINSTEVGGGSLVEDKVSIIIPFYNCQYVQRAIDSALSQTYSNCEVIVVNDGSTSHVEKLQPYIDKVKVIHKKNGGTASALNEGIKHATGTYFSWLSSDDLFAENKIEEQLKFMKSRQAKISFGNYHHVDDSNKVIAKSVCPPVNTQLDFWNIMLKGCIINGCTVMMEMDIFKRIGYFDETLKYAQDYDLWLRAIPHYAFHYFPEPLVYYRVHNDMGSARYKEDIPEEIKLVQSRHQTALEQLIHN